MTRYRIIKTFAGRFALIERPGGELETCWADLGEPDGSERHRLRGAREDTRLRPGLARKLERYFAGHPVAFDDVPLPAGPPFYRACWRACRRIPWGKTRTYGQLAAAAGSPKAVRAAGQAMRHNPLAVIVPCHRVLGSGNTLHGYAGSQDAGCPPLNIKERLLMMEGARDGVLAAAT
jgi:methylated-DNA-[protein]-cysteine S-methyltransferase